MASGTPRPTPHLLRHAFAVTTPETCPDERDHITQHMLGLSTYLGHAKVASAYDRKAHATNSPFTGRQDDPPDAPGIESPDSPQELSQPSPDCSNQQLEIRVGCNGSLPVQRAGRSSQKEPGVLVSHAQIHQSEENRIW